MPSKYKAGDVIFSDGGETLLYGWLDAEEALNAMKIILMKLFSHRTLKKSKVAYGNTFLAETIPMVIQVFITRAKTARGVHSRPPEYFSNKCLRNRHT